MLDTHFENIQNRRKRFTVYSPTDTPDITPKLSTRNVTVEKRPFLPSGTPPFVTIHDDDTFVGALSLEDLEALLTPPIVRPGEWDGLTAGYRALLDVLEETLFTSLNRRQLLATSREIEDRAFRVGSGTLHVTFQSFLVFSSQLDLYRLLGTETALDIHIYGFPDWQPPPIENLIYHPDATGSLAPFWCLAFDGGPDQSQACVLLAREETDGYLGFWSYDEILVREIQRTLESLYN